MKIFYTIIVNCKAVSQLSIYRNLGQLSSINFKKIFLVQLKSYLEKFF
jgi:hypothetical protein